MVGFPVVTAKSERGSVLPVTLAAMFGLLICFASLWQGAQLISLRVGANQSAHELAVVGAEVALMGLNACGAVSARSTFQVRSCQDSGAELAVAISVPLAEPIGGFVIGEARVGYGSYNSEELDP